MPAPTLFDRPTTAAVSEHVTLAASSAAPVESSASVAAPVASDAGGAAHRAVDAVLTAVDRFSAGDRHAVNLHFSVAGADLDVRVELRANEVRTVFRTDSPELRAALAHEWRAENGDAADRSVRLAPPVFASGDSASHGSFSDGGASHHRDSGAQHLANENFESLASRARAGGPAMPATSGFTPAVSHIAAPATTLHLHALA